MATDKRRCSLCNGYQYDPKNDLKVIKGRGRLCTACRTCRECEKPLPLPLLGIKGYNGQQAKLCTKCHKAKLKDWRKVKWSKVPRLRGNQKRLVSDESTKLARLKTYVRLEREGADGVVTVIEFAVFCGDRIYSASKRVVTGVTTARYKTNKKGERVLDGRSLNVVRRMQVDLDKGDNGNLDTNRLLERPVDLLRHLGYRLTSRRLRGKAAHVGPYEAMTWAEEAQARRNELIEEGLPASKKKFLEQAEARRDKVLAKLEDFEASVLDEEVDEAPTAEELENMVAGIGA